MKPLNAKEFYHGLRENLTIEEVMEAYLKHRVEVAREMIKCEIMREIELMAFDRETQCMNDAYDKSIKIVETALKEIEG